MQNNIGKKTMLGWNFLLEEPGKKSSPRAGDSPPETILIYSY